MRLHSMGMSARHEDTFEIDRPYGSGDNLLIIFKTDAWVWNGDEQREVPSGSFILYTKNTVQKYGADYKPYTDHYIHFDSVDEQFFSEVGVWTDRVGYIQNIDEIENLMKWLSREQISDSVYREENINLFLQLIIRKLGENQCEIMSEDNKLKHLEELTALRSEMYSTPDKYKSISEMAEAANLSLSYFQALYRNYYGVSCYDDLLNARIIRAMESLQNTDMSIREISWLCGYESDTCFMRCFKKRTGVTPSEYRHKNGKPI